MRSVAPRRLEFLIRERSRGQVLSQLSLDLKKKRVCAKGPARDCVRLQPHLILCSAVDHSPPGSALQGILQARTPEWVVKPSSRASSRHKALPHTSCGSCITGRFFICLVARQAPGLKVSVTSKGLCRRKHTLSLLTGPNP